MSQSLLTTSIEDATLTLTNTSSASDGRQLKNRDLRVKAIDEPSGSSTIQITINYGTATTVEDIILGNLTTSAGTVVLLEAWNGSTWNTVFSETSDTYTNANYYRNFTQQSATQYRLNLNPDSSAAIELGCIFLGTIYTFPVNYQIEHDFHEYYKGDVQTDAHLYPYSESLDPNIKKIWDLEYKLTDSQRDSLSSELQSVEINRKAFFFQDTNIDTSWRLVRLAQDDLKGEHIAYNYKRISFRVLEL